MQIRSQKKEGNKVAFEIEEDYPRFEEAFGKALAQAGREIKLPGFRPGKAPKAMVEKALDREYIEQRAAQNLIADLYPAIIEKSGIEPVDYPGVEVTQNKSGQPFTFKLAVDVYPEVKLGKYKGLKVEKPAAETSEAADAQVRDALVALASAEAKAELPAGMVEREIDGMLDELKASLSHSGLTLEDYLRGAKKEERALRDEMRKSAQIRAKGKVVLKAVAEAEKIKVSEDEYKAEVKAIAEAVGEEAEAFGKKISPEGRKHIEEYLLRKKALDFLVEKASINEKELSSVKTSESKEAKA